MNKYSCGTYVKHVYINAYQCYIKEQRPVRIKTSNESCKLGVTPVTQNHTFFWI